VVYGAGEENEDGENEEDEFEDNRMDDFFDGMRWALKAVHVVAPLEEAVFQNARYKSESDWEDRSLAAKPAPGPFPRWSDGMIGTDTLYSKLADRFTVEDFTDPAFEAARTAARKELGREPWFAKYKEE
jgi:hypothetical protein